MTAYDTTALATAIIGEDKVTANRKSATRTLRKFLRTDFAAREVATPGKGGRYSIDLNKRDLNAMIKRFAAWEIAQAKEAEARRAALAAKGTTKVDSTPEAEEASDEVTIEMIDPDLADASDEAEGPADEDLDAMILELQDEASDEVDEN